MLLRACQANWKPGDWKNTPAGRRWYFHGQRAGCDGPAETCCLPQVKPRLQQSCLLVVIWSLIHLSCDGLGQFDATKT